MSDLKGLLKESNQLKGMKTTENFSRYAIHEVKAGIETDAFLPTVVGVSKYSGTKKRLPTTQENIKTLSE